LLARPEVTAGAISGHSMGAVGAILAGAADDRVAAIVATSAPADPYTLTRQTFRLAHLPIPDPIAVPLAWLTARVYLRPRGHDIAEVSASAAIARYAGPVLLVHGDEDSVVPVSHLRRLEAAARKARAGVADAAPIETMVVAGGQHSWLYEFAAYRRAVAGMLTVAFGGPLDPDEAGDIAAATPAERIPDAETRFAAVEETPGGLRTLAQAALAGGTRRRAVDTHSTTSAGPANDPGQPAPAALPARVGVER